MAAPYQVVTSTATTALAYAPQQRIVTLCDGSLLVVDFDGSTSAKLTQITNPSGASPTMTAVSQSFSIASAVTVVAALYVLHNGTTSDDVWVAYSDNSSNTSGLYVAHGTYTASGATWSWDNTGTSIAVGVYTGGFMTPTLVWTGTYLIVATRANSSNWNVVASYTTTKNGSGGWAALFGMDTATASTHDYPILLHDAVNGCALMVYAMSADTVYARVLPDASSPALANWSAHVALSGTVGVGAANLTATLDTANKNLHVAWCDSTASPNPHYVVSAYTTTTISAGTAFAITGGGGTGAISPTIGVDATATPTVYLFWASAAAGSASDVSYVTIASPYASGNVSSVTNKTNASTNDNVFPHVPQQEPMSGGYVPLIYLRSKTTPYPVEFDNTISAGVSGTPRALAGESDGVATASAALAVSHALTGASAGVATATAALTTVPVGTGIGDLAVTTKSQSWSGGPSGSPGTETDVTYQDANGGGWSVGLIPSYGGAAISSWYEVDGGAAGANQTSLITSTPDGHIHWLEQSSGAVFAGSEDLPYTLTEQAPTGTAFRRYYKANFGPDANGFNWNVYACIYPGDPGFIAYRFDCINPSGSAITLAGTDGMEIALIGGLQQNDGTWATANGFYGSIGGSPTTGWPSALTTADPDYVGIAPAGGSGVAVGVATIKQKAVTAYSPAWSSAQIQYLQSASRLKLKVQGTLSSFPGSTTSTVYLLNVRRRALTAADAAAMAADYQAPGTPTMTAGAFTNFSYDERAWVFAASGSGASSTLGATLDLSPAHVTVRYKPILKITGWTGGTPQLLWGGSPLVAGVHYRHLEDVTNSVLYVQLYFDVVASGAAFGQRNNAALAISSLWTGESDGVATATATLTVSHALVGASAGVATGAAALTISHALTGASAGVATATGALSVAHPLTGVSAGLSTAVAALSLSDPLSGESDGASTATATLTLTHALSGESDGAATAAATLTLSHAFAGESDGVATANATMTPALSGESDGVATATATMTLAHALGGAAGGVSSATGALSITHALSGESDGAATASATLSLSHPFAGESDGVATATATLGSAQAFAGASDGGATASVALTLTHALAGESDGAGTAQAAFSVTHALAGESDGEATAIAALGGEQALSGTAVGIATASAALIVGHALSGVSAGAATALVTLSHSVTLAGEADGVSTALALLLHSVLLAGISNGVATATGAFAPVHPLVAPSGVGVALASGGGIPSGVGVAVT